MSDPLALLPLALAAGGGKIDDLEAGQLVAAGLTLLQRCAPLVRALSGRRAAILLPTSAHYLVALAASEGRGAVFVNPLAARPEVAYQLRDANVGAVFTTTALARHLPDDMPRVLLDDAPRTARWLANGTSRDVDLGAHHGLSLEGSTEVEGSDEEAAVIYTSAMAGTPLGARLTHRNLLSNARATVDAGAITSDDHMLAALPYAHLFGFTVTCAATLLAGARVTTMERFHPALAVEVLGRAGITLLVGVPAMFASMLAAIEPAGKKLTGGALRMCICGGAVLPVELQGRWFDATGVELRQGYGLTEAGPVCLFNRMAQPNVRGALGAPMPGVQVAIRKRESDDACATGEQGEICVRGPNVFAGYVSGGDAGLSVRDGWLRTGDLGAMRADGYVEFRGIAKAMFTRNGFNVYPREIEKAVCELAGVERAEVRAIPEPSRENDIALRVVGRVGEEDVRRWCLERLDAYKQPSVIEIA